MTDEQKKSMQEGRKAAKNIASVSNAEMQQRITSSSGTLDWENIKERLARMEATALRVQTAGVTLGNAVRSLRKQLGLK